MKLMGRELSSATKFLGRGITTIQKIMGRNLGAKALGGTITYSGGYAIHTFTTGGTFTALVSMNVEYIIRSDGFTLGW